MEETRRHQIIYRTLYHIIKWPVKALFGFTCGNDTIEEPTLIVSNHVTDVDFFFVALGLQGKQMYYVASEHIFRLGWVSKLINWLVAPIARRKGTTAMDTAMTMVRKLRAGHSVCVFGEGESTWNGLTIPVYPATATLARASGKPMKTYRIEGGHLTMPRWGKGIRRGRVHAHVVNTYTPEQLKKMTVEEINEAINRDLYEDAWARQKQNPVRYRSRKRAQCIETALFLCPECKRVGTIYGKKHHVACDCGFRVDMTEYGTFEPAQPFETIAQWDKWQMECLKNHDFAAEAKLLDRDMTMYRLNENNEKEKVTEGDLWLDGDVLRMGDHAFELSAIKSLALIQKRVMILTCEEGYFELRAKQPRCLRKYLAAWNNYRENASKAE